MTEKIECKYKFQDKEKYKFDGKPYCTLFHELCEDVFAELGYKICEENCGIYDDYKVLKLKEQECEKYKSCLEEIKEFAKVCRATTYCEDCKYNNNCGNGTGTFGTYILKKISEVENDSEN